MENQTRRFLVEFNRDFGRVVLDFVKKEKRRRRGMKSEKKWLLIRSETTTIYSKSKDMTVVKGFGE